MHIVAEHLLNNAAVMLLLVIFDHGILSRFVVTAEACPKVRDRNSARWFLTHAFANALVVITCLRSMASVVSDPYNAASCETNTDTSMFGSASRWPLTIINSVHVYHMVGGFGLRYDDYFHHLMFIPTLGFPGQVFCFGALGNWQAFFISGFPGGLDYLMLGLIKIGAMEAMTEKKVNANLNTWLRAPGILTAALLLYQALIYGNYACPLWAAIIQLVLAPYNALRYGKQAVANYAVHYMLSIVGKDEVIQKRIIERTSRSSGAQVLDWKSALGEPQRGS